MWLGLCYYYDKRGTSHRGRLQRLERLEDIADGEWTREYKGRSRSWDNVAPSASSELNRNWGQRLSSVNVAEPSLEPASLFSSSSLLPLSDRWVDVGLAKIYHPCERG